MNAIPDDIYRQASDVVMAIRNGEPVQFAIAVALMAERERCARIVDNHKRDASFDDSMVGALEHNSNEANIAAAIRGEPHHG